MQFAQNTTSSTFNPSTFSPRHHRTRSSPSYMSPTRTQMLKSDEEFVIGCSVCGSRAIEETCFAENPNYSNSIDDPNSGAYARLIAYYEKPLEELEKSYTELKSVTSAMPDYDYEKPFDVALESKQDSPVVKRIVYKEFSPPGKTPLTPLNYKEKQLIKECFYTNPTATKFVKEEERKIVVSRRNEYMNRSSGQVKTFVRTDTGDKKSNLLNRNTSDYDYKLKNTSQKISSSRMSEKSDRSERGRKKDKDDDSGIKSSSKGYTFKIHCGDEDDKHPDFSDIARQIKDSKKGNNNNESSSKKIMKSSPGSRSESPLNMSFSSNKSGSRSKNQLHVPDGKTNKGPSSKNNSKKSSRSSSPHRSNLGTLTVPSKSGLTLSVPKKSSDSSRSVSPNQDKLSVSSRSGNSKSPLGSPRELNQGKNSKNKGKNDKWKDDKGKNDKGKKGDKFGNDNQKGKGGKNQKPKKGVIIEGLKTTKKKGTPPPLPKLFEPRNLREFFFIQNIAATIIQRAWRKVRENRKKNSASAQWEPKDFAGDCKFTSEELFKAMKLLGNFADFMEKNGLKII
ncbi:hypothetical protein SteCoe_9173 [Stentor coeruleus]|uniref:Uncharacterized protein n=1 Tax=Stentor coeruleus TaxID=5963 RepID=A0A1R2CID2_9CILI|nr:hypothetical protein SteCoe_9173 [Stentor coeruleus]